MQRAYAESEWRRRHRAAGYQARGAERRPARRAAPHAPARPLADQRRRATRRHSIGHPGEQRGRRRRAP
ncbi:MAG: hypothetical protein DIU71_13420 [Proteobacteria bacterium]|nr:MAG: hypothetical protein DIU71_13420 [Pseudomonadota bacterium]